MLPQVDESMRRGVMFDRRLLAGLRAHAPGGKLAAELAVEELNELAAAPGLQFAKHRGAGRRLDVPLRHNGIHKSERFRAGGARISPGQHHGHGLDRIDQARQTHRAAKTGMQAEQHFGKTKLRIFDGDAVIAGERNFEPAAEAVAVNDGDDRHREPVEAINDGVRLAQAIRHRRSLGHGAEFADVRSGDEAAFLCRAQHHASGQLARNLREHVVEIAQHLLINRVGAAALLVEDQPSDSVIIAGKLPVPPGAGRDRFAAGGKWSELEIARRKRFPGLAHAAYTASISMAPPCPPPMHWVAMPCLMPSRRIALTRCSTMRLPLAPTG